MLSVNSFVNVWTLRLHFLILPDSVICHDHTASGVSSDIDKQGNKRRLLEECEEKDLEEKRKKNEESEKASQNYG